MKKRKLLPLLLALCLVLSACGSAGKTAAAGDNGGPEVNFAPQESAVPQEPEMNYGGGPSADGDYGFAPEEAPGSAVGAYYDNTKVIRTADLSLQSTEFDAAAEALNALVQAQGGYYESSDFTYGSYSGSGERWASFTVRVPRENFDAFLSAVGEVAHVVSRNTGVQDVGEAYYDAELHVQTLTTKHERLLALLEKAELMEDIISLESALSDVEYELQQYSSTLKRYDALIDFSTINISLREVVRVSDTVTEVDPLSARLGSAFSRGWNSFCDSLADFALWCAYNFMGILILLALAAVAALVLVKLHRRRRGKKAWAEVPAPPESSEPKDKTK